MTGLDVVNRPDIPLPSCCPPQNLFIASRCPDMLVIDLLSQSAVVIINGSALIATTQGRHYPCWAMKVG